MTPRKGGREKGTDADGKTSVGANLSEEDARLWEQVAQRARPLARRSRPATPEPDSAPVDWETPSPPAKARKAASTPPAPPVRRVPPLAPFDSKEARQIGGGRLEIDARVDLHGLRQRDAHRRLKAFLVAAQASGARRVLVITGKGKAGDRDDAPESFWRTNERGVLKRAVPQWLAGPEFRQWVVGFTAAGKRHGGEGALYVRLRKARAQG